MKNEYCITWKLYRSWAFENLFKGARLTFLIIWSLFCLVSLWLGLSGFNIFYIFLAIFCFYRAVLRTLLFAKKQYKTLVKMYGKENWTRTITFEDSCISLIEGPISIQYSYTDLAGIREKDNKIWLIFNNSTVIRLYKNAFVDSDWTECKSLITARDPAADHTEKKEGA